MANQLLNTFMRGRSTNAQQFEGARNKAGKAINS